MIYCKEKKIDTWQYKDSLYYLWATNMDRVMMPAKYMDEFNKVPRSHLRLTATMRHSGKYTGMDIADEGMLGYNVCSVHCRGILVVWHNQPTMDFCMHSKEGSLKQKKSMVRGLLQ